MEVNRSGDLNSGDLAYHDHTTAALSYPIIPEIDYRTLCFLLLEKFDNLLKKGLTALTDRYEELCKKHGVPSTDTPDHGRFLLHQAAVDESNDKLSDVWLEDVYYGVHDPLYPLRDYLLELGVFLDWKIIDNRTGEITPCSPPLSYNEEEDRLTSTAYRNPLAERDVSSSEIMETLKNLRGRLDVSTVDLAVEMNIPTSDVITIEHTGDHRSDAGLVGVDCIRAFEAKNDVRFMFDLIPVNVTNNGNDD